MPYLRHIVTKGSDDGTFEIGDRICFNSDGCITCARAGGWIDKKDVSVALIGMESIPDQEWIKKRKEKLQAELKLFES